MRMLLTDHFMRVYDTSKGQFRKVKMVQARDVGWSVVDTCFRYDFNMYCLG